MSSLIGQRLETAKRPRVLSREKEERERRKEGMEERESDWVRERESRKEAELGMTSPKRSPVKMARLLWLGEEGREGARNLFSPLLTGPCWPNQILFNFFLI